jgi:flavodoxin
MRALVVYESMFGATRQVAERIGEGLGARYEVSVVRVGDVTAEMVAGADVVVVGGPTHAHGLSSSLTRDVARSMARRENTGLTMEPSAAAFGLRDWFKALDPQPGTFSAAFDTRGSGPALLTGRASSAIARRLAKHQLHVAASKSFRLDKDGHLAPGELERARAWGEMLGQVASIAETDADADAAAA